MADENNIQTPHEVDLPVGGLPSDNIPQDFSGFELNDDFKAKFKDGKLNGRFSNVNEVLAHLKTAEDFKANTIRDQKTDDVATHEAADAAAKLVETQTLQQNTVMDMLPNFIKNDMQLTPEMEAEALKVGIDIRDLKLGAMELKDKVSAAHAVIGSADEYNAMLAWGKENMTDAQMKAFDVDVSNSDISSYAIKGLHSDYKEALTKDPNAAPATRINGQPVPIGLQPYASRKDLFKDKRYIESKNGRRDIAAINKYNARKNITPDSVILGN